MLSTCCTADCPGERGSRWDKEGMQTKKLQRAGAACPRPRGELATPTCPSSPGGRLRAWGPLAQPLRRSPRAPRPAGAGPGFLRSEPRLSPGRGVSAEHLAARLPSSRTEARQAPHARPRAPPGPRAACRPGEAGSAAGTPRPPAPRPSPVEGELLPAAAVAVATLPGRARLRHLRTPGPAAPIKDGAGEGALGATRPEGGASGRSWPYRREA